MAQSHLHRCLTSRMGVSRWWDEQVVPRVVDVVLADRVVGAWRSRACAQAHGDVLELGFGSGGNLGHYPAAVGRVLAVEPSDLAWSQSARARATTELEVTRVGLDGARIPLPDNAVDTVVATWTLCTIRQLGAALGEVHRLLRPGGRLLFAEHSIPPDRVLGGAARGIAPAWAALAGGCRVDRDIPGELQRAGLAVQGLHAAYLTRAVPFGYFVSGSAQPARS